MSAPEPPVEPTFLVVPIAVDPDLGRDVFWMLDGDGQPVGIGLFPSTEEAID